MCDDDDDGDDHILTSQWSTFIVGRTTNVYYLITIVSGVMCETCQL